MGSPFNGEHILRSFFQTLTSIDRKSNVPVWSDTLEPVSSKVSKSPNESKEDSNKNISTDFPATSSVTTSDVDSQRRSPRDTLPSSPAPTSSTIAASSTPQEPPPRIPTSVSSRTIPPSTPNHKPLASPKRQRHHVPRASLDLATAIQLSQRNNASPTPRRRLTTSSSSVRSTISPAAKRPGRKPGGSSRLAKEPAAAAHVGDDDEKEAVGNDATVTRRKSVLRESSGWTVIQEIADPDSSDKIEEEEHDQLVEDEEYELRDEIEAAEAASIGTPRDESDDERDQVESVAILSGDVPPSPVMDVIPQEVVPLPKKIEETKDGDLDHLTQGFLTRYGPCFVSKCFDKLFV